MTWGFIKEFNNSKSRPQKSSGCDVKRRCKCPCKIDRASSENPGLYER